MITKLVILIILLNLRSSLGQILSCSYRNDNDYGYTCDLTIQNPNGLNNFASIGGTHLSGKTNSDVRQVFRIIGSNTTNVPSIICDTFQSVTRLVYSEMGIKTIDEKAFKNCKKLQLVGFTSNKISRIDENAFVENSELLILGINDNHLTGLSENYFKNLQKLTYLGINNNRFSDLPNNIFSSLQSLIELDISASQLKNLRVEWFLPLVNLRFMWTAFNQIEELPRNIFMPLKKLEVIFLDNNKLKVIHSDPFRGLTNLREIYFYNNQIEAIDENFIDNTGVKRLNMNNNLCMNREIFDDSTSRVSMRLALQTCFKNFDDLLPGKFFNSQQINFL